MDLTFPEIPVILPGNGTFRNGDSDEENIFFRVDVVLYDRIRRNFKSQSCVAERTALSNVE